MGISGLRKNMSKGRIPDGAVMQITESQWVEEPNKNGDKDVINWHITFLDSAGTPVNQKLYLTDAQYCHVEDGQLVAVEPERFRISQNFAAGMFLASLEEAGFSSKKLDNIGDHPEAVDGQWVRLKNEISGGSTKADGTPYTNLVVDELVDGPGKGAKAGTSSKATASKKGKPEPEPDEDEDESNDDDADESDDEDEDSDEDSDEEEADPHRQAASDLVVTILKSLKSKQPLIANFDKTALGGGATLKQVYTTSFKVFKGKSSDKSAVTSLVNDIDFHKANAKAGLYKFDSKKGVLSI